MTKTQIRILQLGKRSEGMRGSGRFLIRLEMLFLECIVVFHKFFSVFYRGKSQTFELFALRDEFGSFQESFGSHERFRKTSARGVALVVILSLVYVVSGIVLPSQISIRAASYTVNQLGDSGDGVCDGTCTLRDAILNANATNGVPDGIAFSTGGTIALESSLPTITDDITIDGDVDDDGDPDVVLDGATNNLSGNGLTLVVDNSVIEGLVINGFDDGNGIDIDGSNNQVITCYIGTNLAGTTAVRISGGAGVYIHDDGVTPSTGNSIGGTTAATRNVLSGANYGVVFEGSLVQGNTIQGNYIGIGADGNTAVPNTSYGVLLRGGAHDNTVGGDLSGGNPGTGVGNVIAGNNSAGLILLDDNTNDNTISGNTFGLNTAGDTVVANGDDNINASGASSGNVIGGADADHRNIISGASTAQGVELGGSGTTVQGNYIGTSLDGTTALPNNDGVQLSGTSNTIRDNVISGNNNQGIRFIGGDSNVVAGNIIGLNAAGSDALANGGNGIAIAGEATNNTIGGSAGSDRNIIAGNTASGIELGGGGGDETNTKNNVIKGNFIGTDATGAAAIPNNIGVNFIGGVTLNTLGGSTAGTLCASPCNVISGNTSAEVRLAESVHDNAIQGNIIGLVANATKPIRWENEATGIIITGGAYSNTIGGDRDGDVAEMGEGNVIGGYAVDVDDDNSFTGAGIQLEEDAFDGDTTGNNIFGNLIGVGPNGVTQDIYNNITGASSPDNINDFRNASGISTLADYTAIGDGTSSHRNVITGNLAGVRMRADSGIGHVTIRGNYIGTDKTGELTQDPPGFDGAPYKFYYGVWASGTDHLVLRDNVISGFLDSDSLNAGIIGMGVMMGYLGTDSPTGDNTNASIVGNKIGTNKDGTDDIANYASFTCEQLSSSTIGGPDADDRNLFAASGLNGTGVVLGTSIFGEDGGCHDVVIENNFIGTDATGNQEIANHVSVDFSNGASDITLNNNLFGSTNLGLSHVTSFTVDDNTFGIGADGTTEMGSSAEQVVSIQNAEGVTLTENQFGNADNAGVNVVASASVTINDNFFGTNTAKTATYPMGSGITLSNNSDVDVIDNTIRNGTSHPLKKYVLSNSAFAYDGNDYTSISSTLGSPCLGGQKGIQTIYYNTGLGNVFTGSVCTTNQVLSGITLIEGVNESQLNDVKAYLITKSGLHYTVLVAQPSDGPFTCSFVASNTFSGGTCDKEFLLYQKSGTSYTTQSLPSGVTMASGAGAVGMTGPVASVSGMSVLGANGDTLISGNEVTNNDSTGVLVFGGAGVTLHNNTISNNSGDGVELTSTEQNTVTSNTITDNGDHGILLATSTNNSIGEVTEGNTVSGHQIAGIALTNLSDDNDLSSNTLTENGADGDGAGLYINESSDNTVYDSSISENVVGVALSSSDDIASQGNVIGGSGGDEANTIQHNSDSGVVISGDNTQGNTVRGNTLSNNDHFGIENITTHSNAHPTPDDGDNLILSNDITENHSSGIQNTGASPHIFGNTFVENQRDGITNLVDFGSSADPATASDDIVSEPLIGNGGALNIFNDNTRYGIYSLDTAPSNKETLADENDFNNGNVEGRIRQDWYGLVYAEANDEPEEGAQVHIFANGESNALSEFATAANGFGPSDADLHNTESWQVIPERVVTSSGVVEDYTPHRIVATGSAGTANFAFDGETDHPQSNADAIPGNGTTANIGGRYQVAVVDLTLTPNTIQGTVYKDLDGNASRGDEPGFSGVTVTAYLNDDTDNDFFDSNDSIIDSATTDAEGFYSFGNLATGNYFVTVNIPGGYTVTTPNPSERIHFSSEDELRQQDFGLHQDVTTTSGTATIQGKVFLDTDKDGTIDSGEAGIDAFSVKLIKDSNTDSKLEASDALIAASTTNSEGRYSFSNVGEGMYFVSVSVPANKLLTTNNNPSVAEVTNQNYSDDFVYNFGLVNEEGTNPPNPPIDPHPPIPPTGGTTKKPIAEIITGAGVVAPGVGSVSLAIALTNLLLAVPGSTVPIFLRLLLDLFTEPFLALFGAKKLPWGKVFNSLTKRPIDLSLVRLYDARSRILAGTAVTDKFGRFKFLPKPGMYTVKAHKENHVFPSSLLAAAPTYEKRNLYFGDQFIIDADHQTFNRDIPLDPPEIPGERKEILKLRLKQIAHTVFAFAGITISLVNMILLFSALTVVFFGIHVVLLAVFWRLALPAKPKSWGRVYDQDTKKAVRGAVVRIYDQKFGRLLDTAITDRNGRYGFLVGPSTYYLTAEAPRYRFPAMTRVLHTDYMGGPLTIEENKAVNIDIPLKRNPS